MDLLVYEILAFLSHQCFDKRLNYDKMLEVRNAMNLGRFADVANCG